MRVIALIEDPVVVRAILTRLGRWQPKALGELMRHPIHALSISARAPGEFDA